MKKTYQQPSVMVANIRTTIIICGSKGITSDKGIGYGGVDEEGKADPASRRYHRDVWEDDEAAE
jgi:hypothetical protein